MIDLSKFTNDELREAVDFTDIGYRPPDAKEAIEDYKSYIGQLQQQNPHWQPGEVTNATHEWLQSRGMFDQNPEQFIKSQEMK